MEALLGAFGPSIIRKGRVFGSVDSGAVLLVSEDTVSIPFSVCSFLIVNGLANGKLRGEKRKERIQNLNGVLGKFQDRFELISLRIHPINWFKCGWRFLDMVVTFVGLSQ